MSGKKRADGEGSLFKIKKANGKGFRWVMENKRLKVRVTAETQAEAQRKYAEQLRTKAPVSATVGVDGPKTVGELLALYVERGCPTKRRKDRPPTSAVLDRHRWAAEKLSAAYVGRRQFGGFQLAEVTLNHVEAVLKYLHEVAVPSSSNMGRPTKPLTLSSLEKVRDTLRMAFDYGRPREWLVGNVVDDASLPMPKGAEKDTKERGHLPSKEAKRAAKVFEAERAPLFYVLLRMGLRWGEGAALSTESIVGTDLWVHENIQRVVTSERVETADGVKVQRVSRRVVTRDMKTPKSERTLSCPPDVVRVLKAHMKAEAARLKVGTESGRPPLLFVGPTGGVLDDSASRRELARICEAHGLYVVDEYGKTMVNADGSKRVPTPHELRHTWATLAIEGKPGKKPMTAIEVADQLGHTDTRLVFATYRKLSKNKPRSAGVDRDWL